VPPLRLREKVLRGVSLREDFSVLFFHEKEKNQKKAKQNRNKLLIGRLDRSAAFFCIKPSDACCGTDGFRTRFLLKLSGVRA
jgi:hypothetical protein